MINKEWGEGLIGSWNDAGWIDAPSRIGDKIARLIGAGAGEVVACDSTSVNIYKLAAAALSLRPGRKTIVTESGNFPSDVYMLQGLAKLAGAELRIVKTAELAAAVDADTALLLLTHVHYKSGAVHDMQALTAMAQAKGALTLWDLSHSCGAITVDLAAANADFAVGCGYKYLNGGPGAPAYAYAARRHLAEMEQPLTGWMGHVAPFVFEGEYRAAPGIRQLLTGTPSILALAGLEAGIATFDGIDLAACEVKSRALGDYFLTLVAEQCPEFTVACPTGTARRGAHISLAHPHAYAICQALIADGVIGDFREPDVLRLGFPALYTRYVDVFDAAQKLATIITGQSWRAPRFAERRAVT